MIYVVPRYSDNTIRPQLPCHRLVHGNGTKDHHVGTDGKSLTLTLVKGAIWHDRSDTLRPVAMKRGHCLIIDLVNDPATWECMKVQSLLLMV